MTVAPVTRVTMVRPPRGIVNLGVVALRAQPDDSAELVDEAQFGEQFTRLGERGEWSYVQGPDLYFGWIKSWNVRDIAERPGADRWIVAVPLGRARVAPSDEARIYDELPVGTPLLWK